MEILRNTEGKEERKKKEGRKATKIISVLILIGYLGL
jgi:hypothetical protein